MSERDERDERDAAARVASASIESREIAPPPESERRRGRELDRLDREKIAVAAIARRAATLADLGRDAETPGRVARDLVGLAADIAVDPASEIELERPSDADEIAGRLSTAGELADARLDAIVETIARELVESALGARLERLGRESRPR